MACVTIPQLAAVTRSGRLREGALLGVVRSLHAGRLTGVLRLDRAASRPDPGAPSLTLRFVNGQVVAGSAGAPGRLGEILVRCGVLGPSDLECALVKARAEKRRLGPVLCEMEMVSRGRIEDALRLQIRDVLFIGLFCRDGEWAFEPDDAGILPDEEVTLRLSTAQLLLEATHRIGQPEVVREALGDLDRPLAAVEDPPLRLEGETLGPADGFVLSRVDGVTTARQILEITPLPAEEVERSLLALLSAGVIEVRPRPAGPGAGGGGGRTASVREASAAAVSPAGRELLQAAEGLSRKNHFEVLGVPMSASVEDVRVAYLGLAKRFHPDALPKDTPAEQQQAARAVFVRVTDAFRVLREPTAREAYERRFGSNRPGDFAGPRAVPPPAAAPRRGPETGSTPATASAREDRSPAPPLAAGPAAPLPPLQPVQEVLREAEEHLGAGRLWEASLSLEEVLVRSTGRLRQRAHLLLARACARTPSGSKRAEAELKAALEDDPACVEAYLALGQLYREKGLSGRAAAMFRQVLSLEPGSVKARQGLSDLEAPAVTAPIGLLARSRASVARPPRP